MLSLPRQPWPDLQGLVRDRRRRNSRWDCTVGRRSGWATKRGGSQSLPEQVPEQELPLVSARQLAEAALQQLEVALQQLEVVRQRLPVAVEGLQFVGLQRLAGLQRLVGLPAAVQKCPEVNKNLLL